MGAAFPNQCALTAVICSGKALVVAGGWGKGGTPLNTIEVMDTDTLKWPPAYLTLSLMLQPQSVETVSV